MGDILISGDLGKVKSVYQRVKLMSGLVLGAKGLPKCDSTVYDIDLIPHICFCIVVQYISYVYLAPIMC